MEGAVASTPGPLPVDPLGERLAARAPTGQAVETFVVCRALSALPAFCDAVLARGSSPPLAGRGLARVLEVAPPAAPGQSLLVRQEWLPGERLGEIAARRATEGRAFSLGHALFVLREVASALRALHASAPGACHGALSADRILITEDDRAVLCEPVLGAGLAAAGQPREWFTETFGLVVPAVPGIPPFTPLTDQLQLGHLVVELLAGSVPTTSSALHDLLEQLTALAPDGARRPLPPLLKALLSRMLLVSPEGPFRSMSALERALEPALAESDARPVPPPIEPVFLEAPTPEPTPLTLVSPPRAHDAQAADTTVGESAASDDAGVRTDARPAWLVGAEPTGAPERPWEGGGVDTATPLETHPTAAVAEVSPSPAFGSAAPRASRPNAPANPGVWSERSPATPRLAFVADTTVVPVEFRTPQSPARRATFSPPVPARRRWAPLVAAMVAVVAAGAAAWWFWTGTSMATAPPGWLHLESKPSGASVRVNGEPRGQTPVTFTVPPGQYSVEFSLEGQTRALTVPVTSRGEAYQLVSLYPPGPPGLLNVTSTPAGAAVSIDGSPRGRTPLVVTGVQPGEHQLRVENGVARFERTVEVLAGASVDVPVALSGTLLIDSPFEVTVSEGDRLLGRSSGGPLGIGVGTRRLTFANPALNYDEVREVEVEAGGLTRVALRPPTGVINLDADTTAQVFLDGRPLGTTPLPNVAVSLGTHDLLFRDARGGEVRYQIVVALGPAYRLKATLQGKSPPSRRR